MHFLGRQAGTFLMTPLLPVLPASISSPCLVDAWRGRLEADTPARRQGQGPGAGRHGNMASSSLEVSGTGTDRHAAWEAPAMPALGGGWPARNGQATGDTCHTPGLWAHACLAMPHVCLISYLISHHLGSASSSNDRRRAKHLSGMEGQLPAIYTHGMLLRHTHVSSCLSTTWRGTLWKKNPARQDKDRGQWT